MAVKSLLTTSVLAVLALAACGKKEAPVVEAAEEAAPTPGPAPIEDLRLYVLDCGRADVLDLGIFDIGGAYDGQTRPFVDSCYLVRHPKGELMWDAGLPDALAATPEGVTDGPFRMRVEKTLEGQLDRLGVPPSAIDYFSISHSHFDHVGNANLFSAATFIINRKERAFMFREEARADAETFSGYSKLETAQTTYFDDSFDVFGDGSVLIVSMPGHTPGHSVLFVNLKNSGPMLLSGDLYHLTEARTNKTVPKFNTSEAETRASFVKFEELAAAAGARVVIQHESRDYDNLPRAPAYLD
jgi:glyoxylase-like metal-dependent hydrolase (beta-lactamase superfamily II)